MTLSAIDNPYGLIGADSMEADKGAKNSAFSTNSNLFTQLLSTTGVKQVAYRGSNDEFDETLKMQDETVAHEARMGEDSLKYDGLGLNQGDAAKSNQRAPRARSMDRSPTLATAAQPTPDVNGERTGTERTPLTVAKHPSVIPPNYWSLAPRLR